MKYLNIVGLLLVVSASAVFPEAGSAPPEDVFEITAEMLVKNPPRFGVNVQAELFRPWYDTRLVNVWNAEAAFEPIVFRHVHTLKTSNSSNTSVSVSEPMVRAKEGGLSSWGVFPASLYEGCGVSLYRTDKGYSELIHTTKVVSAVMRKGEEETLVFADPGPVPKAGDILVFTKTIYGQPLAGNEQSPFAKEDFGFFMPTKGSGVRVESDPSVFAPEGGSRASLKVSIPEGITLTAGVESGYFFGAKSSAQPVMQFTPGAKYRGQVWLRQEGLGGGEVEVRVGKQFTGRFSVGSEWRKYEFEVANDMSRETELSRLFIGADRPGTLWIDNLLIWQTDVPPFAILPQYLNALKEYRPGCIRLWDGLNSSSMDAWISHGFGKQRSYARGSMSEAGALSLKQGLELCAATGADPWLILHPLTSEKELAGFMEYLGAPADTGYGKIRAEQGRTEPWINQFRRIYIECANEPWNRIFIPLAWPGSGEEYAAVANRMFREIKRNLYYKNEQIVCVAGGWSAQSDAAKWSGKVAKSCVEADCIDFANYYGGWDGVTIIAGSPREYFSRQLLYSPQVVEPAMDAAVAMKEKLGRGLTLALYEGGPGYAVPQSSRPFMEESEFTGKSLALGVVTLDAYMYSLSKGFGHQAYFTFRNGVNWSAFSDHSRMIPVPAWTALKMRNLYCEGDLMKVREVSVKKINLPEITAETMDWKGNKGKARTIPGRTGIPTSVCYAFRNGEAHSVLLLNRSFDEARRVVLQFPFPAGESGKLYQLSHADPAAHNFFEENVKMEEKALGAVNQTFSFILPPASVCVLTVDEK